MLKNYFLFILVLLLASTFIACEKDKEESLDQSGGAQVSGGEIAGGESVGGSQESDMGLDGGQTLDPESQLTGGLEGGSELPLEEPVEGGQSSEIDCEEEDSCLPESEDLPVDGGAQESSEEISGGELVEEDLLGGSFSEE